jgi:hypothetical protein
VRIVLRFVALVAAPAGAVLGVGILARMTGWAQIAVGSLLVLNAVATLACVLGRSQRPLLFKPAVATSLLLIVAAAAIPLWLGSLIQTRAAWVLVAIGVPSLLGVLARSTPATAPASPEVDAP